MGPLHRFRAAVYEATESALGSTTRLVRALTESVFITALGIVVSAWFSPLDPFGIRAQFPWLWLIPTIFALRYGTLNGLVSVAIIVIAWLLPWQLFGANHTGIFPREYFLGGLILVMISGQFADVYNNRINKLKSVNGYIDERLSSITRAHYLLKLSHERIEQELLVRPVTLRDLLVDLQPISSAQATLADSQPLLQMLAQSCETENASIHIASGIDKFVEQPATFLGETGERLVSNDPLLLLALETGELAHVQSSDASLYDSKYLVCAPIITSARQTLGVLVVTSMPFFALNHENLQMLSVLLGYYADGLNRRTAIHRTLVMQPNCPPEFALELTRLQRLKMLSGVDSSLVAFTFEKAATSADGLSITSVVDQMKRLKRSLDLLWDIETPKRSVLIFLLPLSGSASIEGFLFRVEGSLKKQFNSDFSNSNIGIHHVALSAAEPEWVLDDLLNRCRVNSIRAVPADISDATAPLPMATH